MKKRTAFITTLVIATSLIVTPFVFAGPGGHGRGGMRGGHFGALGAVLHAKEELNLSDAQVDEIKGIFKALHEQNAQYREQLRGGLNGVTEALLANPNDIAAAQRILDQQAAAERAVKANLLTATSKALNVLTPEQRTQLSQLVSERKERMAERRQRLEQRRGRSNQ